MPPATGNATEKSSVIKKNTFAERWGVRGRRGTPIWPLSSNRAIATENEVHETETDQQEFGQRIRWRFGGILRSFTTCNLKQEGIILIPSWLNEVKVHQHIYKKQQLLSFWLCILITSHNLTILLNVLDDGIPCIHLCSMLLIFNRFKNTQVGFLAFFFQIRCLRLRPVSEILRQVLIEAECNRRRFGTNIIWLCFKFHKIARPKID